MIELPILSISIFLPLLSALYITLFIGHSRSERKQIYVMYVAILSSVLTLIATSYLVASFDSDTAGYQFVEQYSWIKEIGLEFYVGIDAGSVSLNCIVINNNKEVVYELPYQRHLGKVEEGVLSLLLDLNKRYGQSSIRSVSFI